MSILPIARSRAQRDTVAEAPPPPATNEWVVRVHSDHFWEVTRGLSHRARSMFLALERYARDRAYCWPRVPTLMEFLGEKQTPTRQALAELEGAGIIRAVKVPNRGRTSIIGYVMIRRVDPGMPAADTPERQEQAAAALVQLHRERRAGDWSNGTPKRAIRPMTHRSGDSIAVARLDPCEDGSSVPLSAHASCESGKSVPLSAQERSAPQPNGAPERMINGAPGRGKNGAPERAGNKMHLEQDADQATLHPRGAGSSFAHASARGAAESRSEGRASGPARAREGVGGVSLEAERTGARRTKGTDAIRNSGRPATRHITTPTPDATTARSTAAVSPEPAAEESRQNDDFYKWVDDFCGTTSPRSIPGALVVGLCERAAKEGLVAKDSEVAERIDAVAALLRSNPALLRQWAQDDCDDWAAILYGRGASARPGVGSGRSATRPTSRASAPETSSRGK